MKNRALSLVGLVAAVAIVACSSDTTTSAANNLVTFKATMTPTAEVPTPPVASTGSGTFTAVLDTVTGQFVYDLTFTGLTSGVNNGHIHGPADVGVATGTTVNFNTLTGANFSFGATSGTGHGALSLVSTTAITATMNGDSLKKLLLAGKTYANIHTTSNPNGEIRGQIIKQ
jgi:hypothetical protein